MQDPLKKLGALIKAAREGLDISVEILAVESRVSAKHIRNIEEAKRSELPEEAYLIGFLNKILKALKVENAREVIENYKKLEGDFVVQSILGSSNESNPFDIKSSPQDILERNPVKLSNFKVYHLYIIMAFVLLSMAWFVLSKSMLANQAFEEIKKHTQLSKLKMKKNQASVTNGTELEDNGDKLLGNTKEYNLGSGQVPLGLDVREKAWFQIIGIGQDQVLYEGDVDPTKGPHKFNFKDNIGFVFATGNASAFKVQTTDGERILGAENEVVKWFYPDSARDVYKSMQATKTLVKPNEPEASTEPNNISEKALVPSPQTSNEARPPVIPKPVVNTEIQEKPAVRFTPVNKVTVQELYYRQNTNRSPAPSVIQTVDKKEIEKKKKEAEKKRKKLEKEKREKERKN